MINKKRLLNLVLVSTLVVAFHGGNVLAAETGRQSTTEFKSPEMHQMRDDKFTVIPLIGTLAYVDPRDEGAGRLAVGLALEANAMSWQEDVTLRDWYLGASTGFIYSHIGSRTSNFFGTDPDVQDNAASANIVLIPVDLKVGYLVTEKIRFSILGGGNVMYRSVKSSFDTGGDFATDNSSDWTMYPNLGASLEVGLADRVTLAVKPDLSFTPGVVAFYGMLGIGISL